MSSVAVNVQKHLACHDYHMGTCSLPREKCLYSHVGKSWGICPNKHYCTTPHKSVDCPLFKSNSCPHGDKCSYRHESIKEDKNEEKQILPKKIVKGLKMEDFKSSLIELNQDLRILQPLFDKKKEEGKNNKYSSSGSLDLCFIIDVTSSMSPWIAQVKKYVTETIYSIYDDYPQINLRVALSGYRDYGNPNRFSLIEFTNDIQHFSFQVSGVTCSSGVDLAEDVANGLYNGLQFDWQAVAKQVIFIAESPCHGTKYHDMINGDNYPNGDPEGKEIESLMKEFQSKRIDFTVVEINDSTKKMLSIMKASYGSSLVIKNLKEKQQQTKQDKKGDENNSFSSAVHSSVMSTITTSFSKSGIASGSGVAVNCEGHIGAAYKLIMENKKFKNNLSQTKSKERKSQTLNNKNKVLMEQLNQIEILEEEEFDSDDNEYEEKLDKINQKQKNQDLKDKEERNQFTTKLRLEELKSQFPSHYFETVEESKLRSEKGKKIKDKLQKIEYLKGKINWDNFENFNDYQAVCHSFELVKNYKGSTEINWKDLEVRTYFLGTKVRINNLVFSEGAMRYAFHAKDLYLKQKMVAKQLKKQQKHRNITAEDMKKDILAQIVCKYIVKEFNSKLLESCKVKGSINNLPFLQFIDCFIYEMTFPYTSSPLYYFEQFIEGEYQKFNNNAGYVNQSDSIFSQLAQTLSHFSWQLSKGYLTIVDLQGDQTGMLTDPQIHCLDTHSYGDGNLGYEGILRFFATHECNDYCRQLQLIHPKETASVSINNSFFSEMNSIQTKERNLSSSKAELLKQNINQLCDLCHQPKLFAFSEYQILKKENKKLVCTSCKPLVEKTTFHRDCQNCKKQVTFSTYQCIQLRRDIPPLCQECDKIN